MSAENSYDVIIIGSGIGGLTCGSLLSKLKNKRVLILERHFKAGGFTHVFKREGKFLWDVGVHYIGDVGNGSMSDRLFHIITEGKLEWIKMSEPFEKFIYPDFTFDLYGNKELYKEDLIERFPGEKSGIEKYFHDIEAMAFWFSRRFTLKALPPVFEKVTSFLNLLGADNALIKTKDYLDKNFKDEKLKALLVSQWGDYGLPPSKSSFVIHSLIANHYLKGGYYPKGSSISVASTIKPILEKAGGEIKLSTEVQEIIIQDGKAIGVKVFEAKGNEKIESEYYAPEIVSDAGAFTTYNKLIPNSYPISFRNELNAIDPGVSNVTLYIGFKENPTKLGFKGENYWIYNSYDHDKIYENRNMTLEGNPPGCYLSFPSLKDPKAEAHTAEIIAFVDYEPFNKWKAGEWKNRGEDYMALKEKITEGLLNFIEEKFPGFKELIEYKELSTPLSNEYFTAHKNGTIYGIPCTPERFKMDWLGIRTPVQNLYLTGADACSPGIVGSMMGGYATAGSLMGFSGVMGIVKEASRLREKN
ncbi:MAG: NAD(P)/FAD-dependent oxidoreductase [Leptospiraceae bacterium]|nr:NAD(P)/FAD-dependent oxidoreductase [Leptospiraceae bacterium]